MERLYELHPLGDIENLIKNNPNTQRKLHILGYDNKEVVENKLKQIERVKRSRSGMTVLNKCYNTKCSLNQDGECKNFRGVVINEDGSCSTAKYNEKREHGQVFEKDSPLGYNPYQE